MITSNFLMHYLKNIVYLVITVGYLSASADSFEDFFAAVRNDNPSTLSNLLNRGFDPNTRDAKGDPGLVIAMREQSPKAAHALLARTDLDVNALNSAGESALMMAALKGDQPSVKLLLERGAAVNQPGWSPLHYAATGPGVAIVQLLLDRGAELEAGSPNGTTPLMMAAQYGTEDSVRLLLQKGADPRRPNQQNLNALDFARHSGREAVIKLIEQARH